MFTSLSTLDVALTSLPHTLSLLNNHSDYSSREILSLILLMILSISAIVSVESLATRVLTVKLITSELNESVE
jgi:hypothetical protein